MAKIISFKSEEKHYKKFLEKYSKWLEEEENTENEAENVVCVSKCKNGDIHIGISSNTDFGTLVEMISHLQLEAIDRYIHINFITG